MHRLLVAQLPPTEPARFSRLARGLLEEPGAEPVLLLAPLAGEAVLLGRHQRAASALRLSATRQAGLPLVRRAGGGRSLQVGVGALALLVVVPPGASLVAGPFGVDKVMNRYVRGLLGGLRPSGARAAAWFGRDSVSSDGQRVAVVSQEGSAEGVTALEALVAVSRDLSLPPALAGYPEHADPRAGGPAPATLAGLGGRPVAPEEVADRVARAYAAAAGLELAPWAGPLPEAADLPAEEAEEGFSRSGVAEVAIGFAEALVRHDGARVLEARLRGDFIAPAFALRALEASLAGCPLVYGELGRRVDAAFRQPGAALHGMARLGVLAEAVLAAAGRLG